MLDELVQRAAIHVVQEDEETRLELVNLHTVNQVFAIDGGKEGTFATDTFSVNVASVFRPQLQYKDLAVLFAHDFVHEALLVLVDQLKRSVGLLRVPGLELPIGGEEGVDF